MPWEVYVQILKLAGRSALKRALTPSRKVIESICRKTGANVDLAIGERDEAVEQLVQFIESLAEADFEDPDPS